MPELNIAEIIARLEEIDDVYREVRDAWCAIRTQVEPEAQNDVGIPMQALECKLLDLLGDLDPQRLVPDPD